jgi:hypothetical protein
MRQKLRITAITLPLVNSIGALGGGAGLIYDPSGEFMQIPLNLLTNSSFRSYLIPGVVLLVASGLLSLFVALATIYRWRHLSKLIILQSIQLAGWLSVHIMLIQGFFLPMHLPFYLIVLIFYLVPELLKTRIYITIRFT